MTTLPLMVCAACLLVLSGCASDSEDGADAGQDVAMVSLDEASPLPGLSPDRTAAKRMPEHVPAADVLTAKHANLLALSEEEAQWLDRHGYPTSAELEALLTYDVEELSSSTRNRKDAKAAALLGHREMMDGNVDGAWAAFSAGAGLGSLYAMQQAAIVSAHRATSLPIENLQQADQGNLGVMVARLEVARMLGDHRAQALIDRYAANFEWDVYGKQVISQAAIFMDQYGEYARARGERVRGPDPRPNAELWSRLHEDPNALVTVYTRGRYP